MHLALLILMSTLPQFRAHTIATDLKGGYQVVAADMNGDGKPDLIALASGLPELVWFENPGWTRHVIATGRSRMINVAPLDTDRDGIPELVLAEEFSMTPPKSIGLVSVLRRNGDPRKPWTATEIDRLPSSHRLRWGDFGGAIGKAVVNAPLAGAASEPPDYKAAKVPLALYRPGSWKRELISDAIGGVMHGVHVVDWDGDGHDEILTASFEGIHLFDLDKDGRWTSTRLAAGDPREWPMSGASEVAVGRLGARRFLCSIEPWHGNQVVVYAGERNVIDDTFDGGHALSVADLDGDGRDEIIAGYRGKGGSVFLYTSAGADGARWTRIALDAGGMPAASCAVADFNGDGRQDIACIGGATLKWYENVR